MATIIEFDSAAQPREANALPANIEAEAAFLGACLIDNRVLEDLPVPLTPEHFYEPLHGRIFAKLLDVTGANLLANPVTLKPYFDSDEAMKARVSAPAMPRGPERNSLMVRPLHRIDHDTVAGDQTGQDFHHPL